MRGLQFQWFAMECGHVGCRTLTPGSLAIPFSPLCSLSLFSLFLSFSGSSLSLSSISFSLLACSHTRTHKTYDPYLGQGTGVYIRVLLAMHRMLPRVVNIISLLLEQAMNTLLCSSLPYSVREFQRSTSETPLRHSLRSSTCAYDSL